jgi:hypothetical protein
MKDLEIIELTTGVVLCRNVFDPGTIINEIEKEAAKDWPYLSWNPSSTGNGSIGDYRTSYQMELSILSNPDIVEGHRLHNVSKQWINAFLNIDACVHEYRKKYSLRLTSDEGYRVLKYSNGAEYLEHVDWHEENNRQLSLVGWFNDDFDGGELYFKNFDISVKPEKGGCVLFPSNYLFAHNAMPVGEINKKDIKYSFVTWFR